MRECPICNHAAADGDAFCKNCGLEFANPHGQGEAPAYEVPKPPDPPPSSWPVPAPAYGAPRPLPSAPTCKNCRRVPADDGTYCPDCRRMLSARAAYGVIRPLPPTLDAPPGPPGPGAPRRLLRECTSCHRHSNPEASTCLHCGAPLRGSDPDSALERPADDVPQPFIEEDTRAQPDVGSPVTLAAIILGLLGALGITMWLLTRDS